MQSHRNPLAPQAPSSRPAWLDTSDTPFAQLSRQLRARFVAELGTELPAHRIDLALHEAGAQAVQTGQPELWLPELAREKVHEAATWFARQRRILTRSAISFAA